MMWEWRKLLGSTGEEGLNQTIRYTHDGMGLWPRRHEARDKMLDREFLWSGKRIIFLTRDPRDIIASNFKRLMLTHPGRFRVIPDFSSFLRDDCLGIKLLCQWTRWWTIEAPKRTKGFIIQPYEDTKKDPVDALNRILRFAGAKTLPRKTLERAVEASTIEKMRAYEDRHKFIFPDSVSGLSVGRPEGRMIQDGNSGNWKNWPIVDQEYAIQSMEELPDFLKAKYL
jgi:hypothetical protein